MKRALIACLALLFLGVFLTPGQAQAHAGEAHGYVQSSIDGAQDPASAQDKPAKIGKVSASTEKQTKNCNGSCCGSAGCCVSAGLTAGSEITVPMSQSSRQERLTYNTPPPGPGYPLLRPPRFSA